MKKTIVCLAAKRSGTTALHQMFVKHPEVGICHPNQTIANWEPNFWNYAADALTLNSAPDVKPPLERFKEQMSVMAPHVSVEAPLTAEKIFGYWDMILEEYGPIVFEKSPNYLHSEEGLKLLYEYMQRGNDVRVFGLIRDPRDAISSQYEHWKDYFAQGTPQYRDTYWVEHYRRFQWFQNLIGENNCPLIRYEDFSADPKRWGAFIFRHCGIPDVPQAYGHIHPVHVGRYYESDQDAVMEWQFSEDLIDVAAQYGYTIKRSSYIQRLLGRLKKGARLFRKKIRPVIENIVRLPVKTILERVLDRFSLQNLEALVLDVVKRRVNRLAPAARLAFLFRLDAALYDLQYRAFTALGSGMHAKYRQMKYYSFFTNRIDNADRVLDIGCGTGVVAFDIAEQTGAYVVGIDVHEKNIKTACEHYGHSNLEFRKVNAWEELPEEEFSAVILSNVLEHLSERPAFLRRVQQILQPRRIFIHVPLFERDWRVPLKKELGVEWRLDPAHETEYTLETFAEELRQAGLVTNYLEVRWSGIWAEVSAAK